VELSGSQLDVAVDELVEAELEHHGVVGAGVAAVRGDWSFARGYGVRRVGDPDPVTSRTALDVGSCSKSYVATAAALLVAEGKLCFDDPIRRSVPELEFADPWVAEHCSVRDLLSNRAGLGNRAPCEYMPRVDLPGTETLRRNRFITPALGFRQGFNYANLGFHAVSHVVERAAGLPYAEFLEQRLFEPLGMGHTASGERVRQRLPERAVGHTKRNEPLEFPEMIADNTQGQAGVFSCADDAVAWLRLHLAGGEVEGREVVPASALEQIHAPRVPLPSPPANIGFGSPFARFASYCMGWAESDFYRMRLVSHSGAMVGWRAVVAFVPEAQVGVAAYLASTHTSATALTYPLLELLLGRTPRPDWREVHECNVKRVRAEQASMLAQAFPVPEDDPGLTSEDLCGRYDDAASGQADVTSRDGGLHLHLVDGPIFDARLERLGGNVFAMRFDHPAFPDTFPPLDMRARFEVEAGRSVALSTGYFGCFQRTA
jgi:CubicO group peptidase (beta-lactamase class C family)